MTANNVITLHGTFMKVLDQGVLITGPSGCGKSQLALSLLDRGHQFIADDLISIQRKSQELLGSADTLGVGLCLVRDLGILDIRTLYGTDAVLEQYPITLNIELVVNMDKPHQLQPNSSQIDLLQLVRPKLQLTLSSNRPLALLIETAVSQYKLHQTDPPPWQQFKQRHQQTLELAS